MTSFNPPNRSDLAKYRKRRNVTFSPATIRNDMADLEELGFLEKTHTSSGRVPSEKGYRYYVDHLLNEVNMNNEDLLQIKSIFKGKMNEDRRSN